MTDKRKKNGTFAPGNSGGPGRPKRAVERDYLLKLTTGCSPEDWQEIIEKTVSMAKEGDAKSREWLASYLLGSPAKQNHTTLARAQARDELEIDELEKEYELVELEDFISRKTKKLL